MVLSLYTSQGTLGLKAKDAIRTYGPVSPYGVILPNLVSNSLKSLAADAGEVHPGKETRHTYHRNSPPQLTKQIILPRPDVSREWNSEE